MVDYVGKLVLAPMVRAGELPTRLLALRHGCDLVWGPEIIDKKLLTCERVVNDKLGTIDFLSKGKTKIPGVTNLVFRTDRKLEQQKLIFQMGTANADIAVQAAQLVIGDVDGLDINAGCPKHFSIHGGMGAALLKTPDILVNILESLVENVGKPNNKPISVKIRLMPEEQDSLDLITRLVQTGIANLTVHCRTQLMRNREQPIRFYFHKIKKICDQHNVSLIINGALEGRADYELLKQTWIESPEFDEIVDVSKEDVDDETFLQKKTLKVNEIGGMIATEAEINPTCFSTSPLEWVPLVKEYFEIAEKYENFFANTKYMLTRLVPGKSFFYKILCKDKTYDSFRESLELVNDDGSKKEVDTANENNTNENNDKKHKLEIPDTNSVKKQQVEPVA